VTSDSVLDGNALAGELAEVFSFESTTAMATCAGCGSRVPIATWMVYMDGPGSVARCATCQRVQVRIVHDEGERLWVDLSGVARVEITR
jgi:Family of unknown function (DUF6510)